MIIDGKELLLGRLASIIAKKALLGEEMSIVNCEQIVISGDRKRIITKYKNDFLRGIPSKGPFIHRHPEKFVRRTIRGMLPHKTPRGKEAFRKIKCYVSVPELFIDKKFETFDKINHTKLPNSKFIYVKEICKELGAR